NIARASAGATVTSSGNKVDPNRHELRFVHDGRFGNSRSWMSSEVGKGWLELGFPAEQKIDRVTWGRDREGKYADRLATDYLIEIVASDGKRQTVADSSDRRKLDPTDGKPAAISTAGLTEVERKEVAALTRELAGLESKSKTAEQSRRIFAGTFRAPDKIHLLARGDPEQPGELVAPRTLSAFGSRRLSQDAAEQQRRKLLADWIADAENPLTARVMMNRVWQGHFGRGLVETGNDFGRGGQPPTHPELLDWLASEFIRSGWSVKHMHKLIVLSAAYRQSSVGRAPEPSLPKNADATSVDAEVRLLWRYPTRRLDAETIRDSMLAVSGRLNLKMGGPGYNLFNKRGGLSGFLPVKSFTGDGLRRMIYAHKVRRERDAVFGAFDCPDAGQSTARRQESTTPIQALNLFNSRFTLDQAEAFADRVQNEAGGEVAEQIKAAWRLALTREPTPEELADAEPVVQSHGLATLCRVLFNSNEFLYSP
ncbi:MAG: DUF1553 domain-containing protein, partial [Planctomycetales bacterium]